MPAAKEHGDNFCGNQLGFGFPFGRNGSDVFDNSADFVNFVLGAGTCVSLRCVNDGT